MKSKREYDPHEFWEELAEIDDKFLDEYADDKKIKRETVIKAIRKWLQST